MDSGDALGRAVAAADEKDWQAAAAWATIAVALGSLDKAVVAMKVADAASLFFSEPDEQVFAELQEFLSTYRNMQ